MGFQHQKYRQHPGCQDGAQRVVVLGEQDYLLRWLERVQRA